MPMITARRLCPDLIVIPANFEAYGDYSRQVMALLHDLTPLVEQLSIDEAFLDVTGIRKGGYTIARELQLTIRNECNLPCSLGVATNKLVAKIANNQGKARHNKPEPPCAIEVVPPGEEASYLAPLPIRELWGVGAKTAEQLHQLNISTIGDIARQSRQMMMYHFGKHGFDMWRRAQGLDNRPVETDQEAKSYSKETTFSEDTADEDKLRRVLRRLSEQVGRRLRKADLRGSTVKIKLRWSDFTTITRQVTLSNATDNDHVINRTAQRLFSENWSAGKPVRLIGVGVSNLEDGVQQLQLWESDEKKRSRKIQHLMDDLRERFGDSALQRGADYDADS
jgi:DNA polymerase-4